MTNFKMSWVSPKIEGGKSPVRGGNGVFAKQSINKGEVLTFYGGYVIGKKEFNKLPDSMKEFPYHISEELLLGPIRKADVGISEYYNHSCNPNAGFKDSITLVAIKPIKKGEEITFDYAMCMTSDILNLKCQCGQIGCRKTIRGDDWLKPQLQKKYKKYFIPYIKDKIKNKK